MEFAPEDIIYAKERFNFPSKLEPKIDEAVSKMVGKKIFTLDPRLIKLVVKWKRQRPEDSIEPDNFLKDPRKVEELKKVLNTSL